MTYVGTASVPLSARLDVEATMSWPRIMQDAELSAYGRGLDDAISDDVAGDREEIQARGYMRGAVETARRLGSLPPDVLELAQQISDRIDVAHDLEDRAYWRGYYAGLQDGERPERGEQS